MASAAAPVPDRRSRRRTLPLLLLAVLLVTTALGGCARVRTALAVQPDDTVTGEIVIATPEKGPDDPGPQITLPSELDGDVDVAGYRRDGYTGSVLRFSDLTFDQVSMLPEAAGAVGQRAELTLRRAGGRVVTTGRVDLTSIPVDRADFQLKISFPGEVVDTNGEADSGTVSWRFTPGEVGDVNAVVAYADPNAPSVVNWTIFLGTLVALACAAVVLLARHTRNPPVGPTR